MSDSASQESKLLLDPIIKRIVTVLDIACLSILELLEYNLTRKDISNALANEVIEFDKEAKERTESIQDYLVLGDSYFYGFLNSKVRMTEMGRSLLEQIKSEDSTHRITM